MASSELLPTNQDLTSAEVRLLMAATTAANRGCAMRWRRCATATTSSSSTARRR